MSSLHLIDTLIASFEAPSLTIKEECNGYNNCAHLQRLLSALSYYQQTSLIDRSKFIAFCDKHYATQYLLDYIHFITVHDKDINKINAGNEKCSNVTSCPWTKTHFRDRERNEMKDNIDSSSIMYVDIFDNFHFYLYHMQECGLRIPVDATINDTHGIDNDEVADSNCRDEQIALMQKEIETKKGLCQSFKRLNNLKTSKFTIMNDTNDIIIGNIDEKNQDKTVDEQKGEQIENKTVLDEITADINESGFEHDMIKNLKQYLLIEEYDTECIQNDVDDFYDDNSCNLLNVTNGNVKCIKRIQQFIKKVTISSNSFSTGAVFWYWKYYENIDDYSIKQQQAYISDQNDFSGHSIQDLFIQPLFSSLKEEILAGNVLNITNFNYVILKASKYIQTTKCKQLKCVVDNDELHFGIKKGADLKASHLHAVILYCDFTEFCTDFSSSFRKLKWNETIQCVRDRNRKHFHCSKNLREVIQYYGVDGTKYGNANGKQQGPYFSGLSAVMNISEFSIRLNGPTSVSVTKEIAIRFAPDGMVIQLNNIKMPGYNELLFNTSWISAYPEENERLFCGGRYKLEVENILVMTTHNNYQMILPSFYKFDKMLSGGYGIGNITKSDYVVVKWFIRYILGESKKPYKYDEFIKNTFYLFAQQKTQIVLNLHQLHLLDIIHKRNRNFIGFTMYPIKETQYSGYGIQKYDTNLFKPCLFSIFKNLQEIIIYSTFGGGDIYAFNFFKLLVMLEEVLLPQSFKTIIIKDRWPTGWLKSVYSSRLKKKFDSKNKKIELKTNQGKDVKEDWVIITV